MNPVRKIFAIVGVLVLICVAVWLLQSVSSARLPSGQSLNQVVSSHDINQLIPELLIATSTHDREVGLGKFSTFRDTQGMLFVFEQSGDWRIWMKDMKFSIDIIFLDEKFTVTHLENNISPLTFPTVYASLTPSRYILETNAYFVEKNGIKVGQTLIFDEKTVHNFDKK